MNAKTATLVKKLEGSWTGDARLYRLSVPMAYEGSYGGEGDGKTYLVIVSATSAMLSGPETYIFPATEEGICINYGELDGSFRGGLDHVAALRDAGYTVIS